MATDTTTITTTSALVLAPAAPAAAAAAPSSSATASAAVLEKASDGAFVRKLLFNISSRNDGGKLQNDDAVRTYLYAKDQQTGVIDVEVDGGVGMMASALDASEYMKHVVKSRAFGIVRRTRTEELDMSTLPSSDVLARDPWQNIHCGSVTSSALAPVRTIERSSRRTTRRARGSRSDSEHCDRALKVALSAITKLPQNMLEDLGVTIDKKLCEENTAKLAVFAAPKLSVIRESCKVAREQIAARYYQSMGALACQEIQDIAVVVEDAQGKLFASQSYPNLEKAVHKYPDSVRTCNICMDSRELPGIPETKLIEMREMRGGCNCRMLLCRACINKQTGTTYDGVQCFECPGCYHFIEYFTKQLRQRGKTCTMVRSVGKDDSGRSFIPVQVREDNPHHESMPSQDVIDFAQNQSYSAMVSSPGTSARMVSFVSAYPRASPSHSPMSPSYTPTSPSYSPMSPIYRSDSD